jgi:hypothetical protein
VIVVAAPALAGPAEDAYVAGYATAVLERQMDIKGSRITVKDGVVTVEVAGLPARDREKVVSTLSTIAGVTQVVIVELRQPPATAPAAASPLPTTAATPSGPAVEAEVPQRGLEVLPKGLLFAPLIADPRWPHFSAVYQRYHEDARLGNAATASLGETFSLVRGPVGKQGGAWEVGIQAGVFSLFDLDAPSSDLVNTDYLVGVPFAYRAKNFSALARFFHQSSHLGDEFLLRNRANRVNLSYEGVDVRLSYDLFDALRLYGGGGYLFDRDPASLDPGLVQYGIEVTSPWSFAGGAATPIAAADFQNTEESNWRTQSSVLTGLQLERVRIADTALLLGLEWFRGQSPNGQFYGRKVEWFGVGAYLYF